MPADGNQRSESANTMMSMMPVQKTGRLTPVTATAHAEAVEPGVLPGGRDDARDQAEDHRDGERARGEDQRWP